MQRGAHVEPRVRAVEISRPGLPADGAVAVDGVDAVVGHVGGLVEHAEDRRGVEVGVRGWWLKGMLVLD